MPHEDQMPRWGRTHQCLATHAAELIAKGEVAPGDVLLSTLQVCEWLNVTKSYLSVGRHRGYGPRFIRINAVNVVYRRSDVLAWLEARTFNSTSEYDFETRGGRPKGSRTKLSPSFNVTA